MGNVVPLGLAMFLPALAARLCRPWRRLLFRLFVSFAAPRVFFVVNPCRRIAGRKRLFGGFLDKVKRFRDFVKLARLLGCLLFLLERMIHEGNFSPIPMPLSYGELLTDGDLGLLFLLTVAL
jgi:hypothetical protein